MKTMIATLLQKRLRMCGMLAALAATTGLVSAQTLLARIASDVSGSELTTIAGSQHPLANPTFDAGRMPASSRLIGITIHFSRSAAQEAELDALLAAQQDPHSPQYHQWLTSDQFAARYGMAQADLDKVSSWLEQQGFTIDSVNRSHNAIRFSGSVGQVETAFQTQMHYYTAAGETHYAPSTALSIPAAFAPVVADIGNLNDFRPRANHIVPRAGFTSGVSGSVFFAPHDIVTAYDINPLYTGGVNGAGQTIAIMGQSFVKVSDIEAFQSAAQLTKKDPTLILVPGTGNDGTISQGDEGESDLDLEWSSAIAPGANVVLVYAATPSGGGVYAAAQYAVDEMIGNIISLSYSTCETALAPADLTSLDAIFKQAATQGQTVMAASGDAGSIACSGTPGLTVAQQDAISVNYPASSAYVTGVGGTEIQAIDGVNPSTGAKGANFSTYWNSNYTGTSNVANDLVNSLKQYVPEVVWNDDSSGNLSSTGGGTSALVARPSWQTGVPGIPAGTMRLVPDIAFYSSPDLPGYLYCTSDTSSWQSIATGGSNNQVASCNSGFRDSSTTDLTAAGGTSFATPIFAGMVALLNQKLNFTTGQGLINPTLYTLASKSANYTSGAIHDVTSGNNNCSAGATACGTTTGGFSANAGYDEVTGIGSLDLNLISAVWPANTGASATLIASSTTVSASNTAPTAGASVTFTITVASSSGSTPTGNVTLQVDGGPTFGGTTVAAQPLSSNGTLTYTTSFAASGPHQVLAQYAGDATHAPSVGAATISIGATTSGKGTFAMAATNVTVSRGSSSSSTITVTPSGGYLGTVDLTFTTSNNTALTNLCYNFTTTLTNGTGTVVVPGTAAVTTQLTLDTLPKDCGALIKGKGNHAFKAMHASGGTTRSDNRKPGTNSLPAGIALGGLLLAGFLARGSRRLRNLACVIALGAIAMAVTACGGGGSSTTATPDPPKGTYTVTVTGTDSVTATITANTTFTFTIN